MSVWGLGVQDLGLAVVAFRVQDLGFRVFVDLGAVCRG